MSMSNRRSDVRYCPNPACHHVLDARTMDPCPGCRRADPIGNVARRRRNFLIAINTTCIVVLAVLVSFFLFADVI